MAIHSGKRSESRKVVEVKKTKGSSILFLLSRLLGGIFFVLDPGYDISG